MKKRPKTILLTTFCTLLILNITKIALGQYYDDSQTSGFFSNFSISPNIGVTLPFADISQDFRPYQNDIKFGWGFSLRKQLSPAFGIGAQLITGKIHGTIFNWPSGGTINRYFDSDFMEVNVHAITNLSNLIFGYKENRVINFYGTIGLGFANWASVLRDTDTDIAIDSSGYNANNQKAWTPELSISAGMGLYFALSRNIGFNIEASVHQLNSDDLDSYVSGNSRQDYYAYLSGGVTINLNDLSGVFRKPSQKENKYDKERNKLEKYQNRQEKKNRREEEKEAMRRESESSKKRPNRFRRNPMAGMPKVVEYDAIYSYETIRKLNEQNNPNRDTATTIVKGERELPYDEGKHFITGVKGKYNEPIGSANIITEKDVLKSKSESNQSTISIRDETISTSKIISGGILAIPETGKIYTVQILATQIPTKNMNSYRERFGMHQPIYYSYQNGIYRYSTGLFTNYYDAQTYVNVLKRNGLTDAFVAIYNNGVRVN